MTTAPEHELPAPDLTRTGAAVASPRGRSAGISVLAALAILYTLYFARDFLVPIAFAVLLSFLLNPLVRALGRLHIPPPLGAAMVMVGLAALLAVGIYELSGPVQEWAARAPATLSTAQSKVRRVLRPLARVQKTAEQVENNSGIGATKPPSAVVVQGPSLTSRIFGTTQRLLAGLLEVVILVYFLLAAGDLFLQKLIKVLPNLRDKRKAVEIARETETSISAYLLTAATVNVVEGVVVAGAMYLLGMPSPALWGALVAVCEFIPYVGGFTIVVILAVTSLTVFDNPGHALLVPASFLGINMFQSQVATPLLLGHRLSLNPVAVFVGLAFWFWIWGVPGAFIAVPIMATFKIVCDHIESLAAIGEFLGQRDDGERRTTVRDPAAEAA